MSTDPRFSESIPTRRSFLRRAAGAAATGLIVPGCASVATNASARSEVRNRPIEVLDALDSLDGGADPFPIPWLDRNGSHNQSPEPGTEPSNIFHFNGRVARANDFTGMGTDNQGRRIAFGAKSTDFSMMQGEYFSGRVARRGAFSHI